MHIEICDIFTFIRHGVVTDRNTMAIPSSYILKFSSADMIRVLSLGVWSIK